MSIARLLSESDALAAEVVAALPRDYGDSGERDTSSAVACSLSLEHWLSVKVLISANLFPSAVVVHRAQFEAIVRSIWLLYAASDQEVARLAISLSEEAEQAAKNLAGLQEMIADIGKKGPKEAFAALSRFRDNALKPINSYVHAGLHPLQRHAHGYPDDLCAGVLRNATGVAVLSWMQSAILARRQDLQRTILQIAARYPSCLPPSL